MNNSTPIKFTLWLEFEEVEPGNWDIANEFCNVIISLEDGRKCGLNVWTYQFLETSVRMDQESGDNLSGLYQRPPDLFVKELTRDCIEASVSDLLRKEYLDDMLRLEIDE